MIEEIQALMPLFDRISDGAFWAFVVYMAVKVVAVLVWPVAFVVILLRATAVLPKVFAAENEPRSIELYDLEFKGEVVAHYLGDRKTLADFFTWAASDKGTYGGYVHSSDLNRIKRDDGSVK